MYFLRLQQIDVAVDARTAVPTAVGLLAVVHTHGDDIVACWVNPLADVIFEGDIAVRTSAKFVAIDIDGGVHINAVELDEPQLVFLTIHFEMFSIPAYATLQGASSCSSRRGCHEIALNTPVVGKVETTP